MASVQDTAQVVVHDQAIATAQVVVTGSLLYVVVDGALVSARPAMVADGALVLL